jgi:hypothetical protein
VYEHASRLIAAGEVPYRDFWLEYPPLAAGLFRLAGAVPLAYTTAFSGVMLLCLAATAAGAVATARALGLSYRRQVLAGGVVAVAPLLLGNLVETRFDLLVSALIAWTLYGAVTHRWRLAWVLLALAVLAKLVPLAFAPLLVVHQRRSTGLRRALFDFGTSLLIVAAVLVPLAAVAPRGVEQLFAYHFERPLQIESSAAGLLLGAHALIGLKPRVIESYGSINLDGGLPDRLATALTVILVVGLVALALALWRRPRGDEVADRHAFVAAAAAASALLLVAGKVLSPQFMVWLLPACLLVEGRRGRAAVGATAVVMVLTQAYYAHLYGALTEGLEPLPIWLLVARNVALVVLLVLVWPRPVGASPRRARVRATLAWALPSRRPASPSGP